MDTARLEIRLKPGAKDLIQQAAEIRNQTVTQFVLATLSVEAGRVVAEHQQAVLGNRDRDLFLRLLDAPPKPNAALRKAAARYRKRVPA